MSNPNFAKLSAIDPSTLIVGVDIAKELQWARFTDYRGLELGKAFKFANQLCRIANGILFDASM